MLEEKKDELQEMKEWIPRLKVLKEYHQEKLEEEDKEGIREKLLDDVEEQLEKAKNLQDSNEEEVQKVISFLEDKLNGNTK